MSQIPRSLPARSTFVACLFVSFAFFSGAGAQRIFPQLPPTPLTRPLQFSLITLSDVTLKRSINEYQEVILRDDPLFKRPLPVRTYSLDALLRQRLPDLTASLERGDTISLLRQSGPALRFPLRDLYGQGALIAYGEIGRPDNQPWASAKMSNQTLSASDIGFYLVWPEGTGKQLKERPWVWGLKSLIVRPVR